MDENKNVEEIKNEETNGTQEQNTTVNPAVGLGEPIGDGVPKVEENKEEVVPQPEVNPAVAIEAKIGEPGEARPEDVTPPVAEPTPEVTQTPVSPEVTQTPVETSNAPAPSSGNKTGILAVIIIIGLVFLLIVVGIIVILGLNKGRVFSNQYSFDYENVPYYIADNDVVIDNGHATTRAPQTTGVKTTSTLTTVVADTPLTTTTKVTHYTTTKAVASSSQTSASTTRSTYSTTTVHTTTRVTTTQAATSNKSIHRTVMVYMIGSNLESQSGAGTLDLYEMSQVADANTDFYVLLGGASRWRANGLQNGDILHIKDGKYSVVSRNGSVNMVDGSTLASFINLIENNTDSEYYDLILWNHGGGPIYGYGSDEIFTNDSLYVQEISNALAKTNFNQNHKLEFIGYDACLMGNVETSYYMSKYADYLIASEESEYGYGWTYDKGFTNASKLDSVSLGKQIINSFADSNAEFSNANNVKQIYTLSLVDLSKVNNVVTELNNSVKSLDVENDIADLVRNRIDSIEFASPEYDLIDLSMYANKSGFKSLENSISEAVVYSNSNLSNAKGLAVYLPYKGSEKEVNASLQYIYSKYSEFSDYYNFIKKFYENKNKKKAEVQNTTGTTSTSASSTTTTTTSYSTTTSTTTSAVPGETTTTAVDTTTTSTTTTSTSATTTNKPVSTTVTSGEIKSAATLDARYDRNKKVFTMNLTPEQVKNFQGGFYVIFKDMGDDYFTPVFRGDNAVVKGNTMGSVFDGKIMNIDCGDGDLSFATTYKRKQTNLGTQYLMPVTMQSWGDDFLSTFKTESGYVNLYIKDDNIIQDGIIPEIEDISDISQNRFKWSIDDWKTVQFWNFRYHIKDANGKYTDNWVSNKEYIGHEFVPYKYPNYGFMMNSIEGDSTYYAVYKYYDIYGNLQSSDLIKLY